jgi:single-strand DNA-binding protein
MFQQVTLVGNLGKDPELRYTPSGVAVCGLSLAIDRSSKDKEGNKNEKTLWVSVTAWNQLAELAAQYLAKGRQVLVIGDLEDPDKWIDNKTGEPAARTKVTARTIKFLSRGNSDEGNGETTPTSPQGANQPRSQAPIPEEEIPF